MSIRRIIRLAVVGWIVSMVVGAIAAMQAKRTIGPDSDESADEFAASAIFGPLAYRSTAQHLREGRLELWYGGGVLDLRDAVLAPDGATLRVRAIFGGGQILVPTSWRVVSSIRGLGGISDSRPPQGRAEDAPELSIEGVVFAGGFAVMSELDDVEAAWLADTGAKGSDRPAAKPDPAPASATTEPEMTPAG
jgi:hypothetical protein